MYLSTMSYNYNIMSLAAEKYVMKKDISIYLFIETEDNCMMVCVL